MVHKTIADQALNYKHIKSRLLQQWFIYASLICFRNILNKNGSAVDATIAAMFCNGVITMQSMGLGGGFLMTIYKRNERKAYFLNARERAPLAATNDLYKNNSLASQRGKRFLFLLENRMLVLLNFDRSAGGTCSWWIKRLLGSP